MMRVYDVMKDALINYRSFLLAALIVHLRCNTCNDIIQWIASFRLEHSSQGSRILSSWPTMWCKICGMRLTHYIVCFAWNNGASWIPETDFNKPSPSYLCWLRCYNMLECVTTMTLRSFTTLRHEMVGYNARSPYSLTIIYFYLR